MHGYHVRVQVPGGAGKVNAVDIARGHAGALFAGPALEVDGIGGGRGAVAHHDIHRLRLIRQRDNLGFAAAGHVLAVDRDPRAGVRRHRRERGLAHPACHRQQIRGLIRAEALREHNARIRAVMRKAAQQGGACAGGGCARIGGACADRRGQPWHPCACQHHGQYDRCNLFHLDSLLSKPAAALAAYARLYP